MHDMKDSGVEWIGEIPAHWSPIRFRFIAKITTGNQDTQNADPDGEYPFYVRSPIVERCNNYTFDGKGILMAGDGAGAGRVFHLVDGKYAVHQRVYRFYDFKYMDPVLLKYYLENLFATVMDYGSAKTTVPSVRLPMIQDFVVCVPPKKEQDNIVAVLNEKCAQVGSLISNVQAQIEKLKAYKQSLITEVVTKGLDPTVPMKDSGVEWIGEIPAHWKIQRGKALFKETDARSADGSEELLTVSQYTGITPRSQKNVTMFEALSLEGYKICEIGDIAANTMWLWAGAIGISEYRGVVSPSYNVYRQRSNNFAPRYLDHLLRAPMLVQEYASLSTGIRASRLRLYPKDFFNIMFPVPPLEEQQAILDALNSKLSAVDRLIAIKQAKIEKLEQYKRSLIYEYVTGKREVI
jgi:type I restriction enzyme S subunit